MNRETDHTYHLLTFAGLSRFALDELDCPGNSKVLRLPNHDLIEISLPKNTIGRLSNLRTTEDIFMQIGGLLHLQGKGDLKRIAGEIDRRPILDGLALRNRLFAPARPKQVTFGCFVKQDRDHGIRRHDISGRINQRVQALFPRWRGGDPASVELWGFLTGAQLRIGQRLSDERMRYHGGEPPRRKGALRPTIAAALVLAADLQAGERAVDPMCGTGTLLREGLAIQPGAVFCGGDSDSKAVQLARARIDQRIVSIHTWDARRLPLEDGSLDCILCNLPFGRQYSNAGRLYESLLVHWRSKLGDTGRMVLLTSACRELEAALKNAGYSWRIVTKVKVLGTWAYIYTAVMPSSL